MSQLRPHLFLDYYLGQKEHCCVLVASFHRAVSRIQMTIMQKYLRRQGIKIEVVFQAGLHRHLLSLPSSLITFCALPVESLEILAVDRVPG